MTRDRMAMLAALEQVLVPALLARGFEGTFPHFRRPREDRIDLLSVQFDRWGGGFAVEIGACPAAGVLHPWGEAVAPERVTTHDLARRRRLGGGGAEEYRFRYDGLSFLPGSARYARVARQVLPYLEREAEPWWQEELVARR